MLLVKLDLTLDVLIKHAFINAHLYQNLYRLENIGFCKKNRLDKNVMRAGIIIVLVYLVYGKYIKVTLGNPFKMADDFFRWLSKFM